MEDSEPTLVFKDNESSLGLSLNALRETGELCDIVIKVKESEMKAHKVVLSARSCVFRAMISGGFKESNQPEILLREESLTPSGVSFVIEYLYTGVVKIATNIDHAQLENILQASDFLGLQDLSKWILNDCIIHSFLNYSTMKTMLERFKKLDYEGRIEEEIRKELKANWEDYLEDNPDDWGFLLKIWPAFDGHINISSYESLIGIVAALNDLNEDDLKKFVNSATLDVETSVKRICMERNPSLYFCFEAKYRSPGRLDWVPTFFTDLPMETEKAVMHLQSLLEFLQQQNEMEQIPLVTFDIHGLYRFKDSIPIQSLTKLIFTGVDLRILLDLEHDDDLVTLCNKFLFGNQNVKQLWIKNGENKIIDSFSQHLIGEMMAEVEHVKLEGVILSKEIMKSLLHCHERKALSKTEKLTSLCIDKNSKPAYNDYSLFSKTLAFLKHLELQGWKSREIGFFLMHSVVHTKKDAAGGNILETLSLTCIEKVEHPELPSSLIPRLLDFLNYSKITTVSFAFSLIGINTLNSMVEASANKHFKIDTLILCEIQVVANIEVASQEIAKLIGLLPLVTISGRFMKKSELKMMRSTILEYDNDEDSAKQKLSNLKGGILLNQDALAWDTLYVLQYHSRDTCKVSDNKSNFVELDEDTDGNVELNEVDDTIDALEPIDSDSDF